jgi:DNA-binding IclR family transcriptional regulator
VFLASMTDKEAKALVWKKGIFKFTDNTIIHPPDFFTEIGNARQNGFAFDDEEYISGVRAVASPIKGKGAYSSAIWVVGFKPRMGSDKMKALARNTRHAAELISQRIGDQTAV